MKNRLVKSEPPLHHSNSCIFRVVKVIPASEEDITSGKFDETFGHMSTNKDLVTLVNGDRTITFLMDKGTLKRGEEVQCSEKWVVFTQFTFERVPRSSKKQSQKTKPTQLPKRRPMRRA